MAKQKTKVIWPSYTGKIPPNWVAHWCRVNWGLYVGCTVWAQPIGNNTPGKVCKNGYLALTHTYLGGWVHWHRVSKTRG